MKRTIDLEFITPLFSHGAIDAPEVRASSIRGQLHAWFRILGGDVEAERRVFGGIRQSKADSNIMPNNQMTLASRIVVRVANVDGQVRELPTLPHKQGGAAAPRKAFAAGARCRIIIQDRLDGLSADDEKLLDSAINAWLLMGTLGYRSTRAAGSFIWNDESYPMPSNAVEYQDECRNLLEDSEADAKVAILERDYMSADVARRDISDSLGGRDDRAGQDDLSRLHNPLGKVFGDRKTSPLKYRLVRFGEVFRILAFWDGRSDVTGNSDSDFYDVVDLLDKRKYGRIGGQLKNAFG